MYTILVCGLEPGGKKKQKNPQKNEEYGCCLLRRTFISADGMVLKGTLDVLHDAPSISGLH